jgi:hypothetical protein
MALILAIWVKLPVSEAVLQVMPFFPEYVRITTLLAVGWILIIKLWTQGYRGALRGVLETAAGLAYYESLGLLYSYYWNGTNEGIERVFLQPIHPALSFLGYFSWDRLWVAMVLVALWIVACNPRLTRFKAVFAVLFVSTMIGWIVSGFHANHYWLVLDGRQALDFTAEIYNAFSKTALLLFIGFE